MPIVVTVREEEHARDLFKPLVEAFPDSVSLVQAKRFDGFSDAIQAIIVLSPLILPALAKILSERLRANKYVVLEHKGVRLKGVSDRTVLKVLQEVLKHESSLKNDD